MALTTPEPSRQRIPVTTSGHISISAAALERIVTRMYRLGKVDGVRDVHEMMRDPEQWFMPLQAIEKFAAENGIHLGEAS